MFFAIFFRFSAFGSILRIPFQRDAPKKRKEKCEKATCSPCRARCVVVTAFVSHGSKPVVATESLPDGFVLVSPTVSGSSAPAGVATDIFSLGSF